jgi:hypothetical protein
MRKGFVLFLAVLILGSYPALAQEKGAGQAPENEKHQPAQPASSTSFTWMLAEIMPLPRGYVASFLHSSAFVWVSSLSNLSR